MLALSSLWAVVTVFFKLPYGFYLFWIFCMAFVSSAFLVMKYIWKHSNLGSGELMMSAILFDFVLYVL